MDLSTSCSVDPNRSPITLTACLMAVVIFAMCSVGVMELLLIEILREKSDRSRNPADAISDQVDHRQHYPD
jgi:hypothetical protein